MSWTNRTTVKTHLQDAEVGVLHYENEPAALSGTEATPLWHRLLTENSETVKWCILNAPVADGPITLTGTNWSDLAHSNILPDSIVVTLDETLSQMYVQEKDYIVDTEQGRIRRTSSSSIPSETQVYVYYLYCALFQKTTDYAIDYDAGTLARVLNGAIPDGATVLVDYDVAAATVSDALIDQAIVEAEDKILVHLSSDYGPSSTDQGLKTGATELTLAIVAEAKAMEALADVTLSNPDNRAAEWLKLAQKLETQAWRTLAPFLDPTARRSSVVRSNLYGTDQS
ncbi:MAG: hypothetical protein V1784_00465 [bacterium]